MKPARISDGLTDGESEIMAQWDGGRSITAIAESTGYKAIYVQEVVARYDAPAPANDPFNRMSATGTAALLAALNRFHPETLDGVHP